MFLYRSFVLDIAGQPWRWVDGYCLNRCQRAWVELRKLKVDKLSADIKADESKVRVEVGSFVDEWTDWSLVDSMIQSDSFFLLKFWNPWKIQCEELFSQLVSGFKEHISKLNGFVFPWLWYDSWIWWKSRKLSTQQAAKGRVTVVLAKKRWELKSFGNLSEIIRFKDLAIKKRSVEGSLVIWNYVIRYDLPPDFLRLLLIILLIIFFLLLETLK